MFFEGRSEREFKENLKWMAIDRVASIFMTDYEDEEELFRKTVPYARAISKAMTDKHIKSSRLEELRAKAPRIPRLEQASWEDVTLEEKLIEVASELYDVYRKPRIIKKPTKASYRILHLPLPFINWADAIRYCDACRPALRCLGLDVSTTEMHRAYCEYAAQFFCSCGFHYTDSLTEAIHLLATIRSEDSGILPEGKRLISESRYFRYKLCREISTVGFGDFEKMKTYAEIYQQYERQEERRKFSGRLLVVGTDWPLPE